MYVYRWWQSGQKHIIMHSILLCYL
jgi:hypothetical protein